MDDDETMARLHERVDDHIKVQAMTELTANDLPETDRTRCEVWTRVMGYHRPTSSFNKGKQGEHRERKFFREQASMAWWNKAA